MNVPHLLDLSRVAAECAEALAADIWAYTNQVKEALTRGGKLMFAGNGGSAAHAQHIATEYVVRYQKNRRALAAVALSTDSSLMSAAGNDLGFEHMFARQVEAIGVPGDLLVLISTSGNSPNLLRAAEAAAAKNVVTVALLAKGGGQLAGKVDQAIVVPTDDGAVAQEIQLAIDHHVCSVVESEL